MSAVRQASPLCFLSSYLLCLMSLPPSTCVLNETMVLSSNKQWVCQVLKGEEDKLREGTRGCEDNGFLWWLTFHSSMSKNVWLSYCVFTDSQMNGGLETAFVCATEGNKHTMSNLYLGRRGVSVHVRVSAHVSLCKLSVTHSPFSSFDNSPTFTQCSWHSNEWVLVLSVSESASKLTNRSFSLSVGIARFLPCCCDTPVTWSKRDSDLVVCECVRVKQ